jgi:hypothetical protein
LGPEPASYDPEEFVHGSQSWPRLLAFKDGELLAKGDVFEHQIAARPKPAKHGSEPEPKQVKHGNQVIADRLCRLPCEVVDFTAGQDCDEAQYCTIQNPLIDADKIAHFAMGIFWKASVHSWRGSTDEPMIQLGPYSEKVRLYLKGEAGFPSNMALAAVLSPPDVAYIGFNNPEEMMRDTYRNFMFVVPGIWFNLSVGKMVSSEAQSLCIASHPLRPIMISASIAAKGQERAYKVFSKARKTESFKKAMEKVRLAKSQETGPSVNPSNN